MLEILFYEALRRNRTSEGVSQGIAGNVEHSFTKSCRELSDVCWKNAQGTLGCSLDFDYFVVQCVL